MIVLIKKNWHLIFVFFHKQGKQIYSSIIISLKLYFVNQISFTNFVL